MTDRLVIGIDSSTTATKAIAWNQRGEAVTEARASIPLANPAPGHFEQDAEDWWRATVASLREVVSRVPEGSIDAVAISNQRETFGLFTDDAGPLRPAMVWLDDRAVAQQHRFGASFGAERIHAISGKPLDIIPCLYRLLWLREHEPENLARTDHVADVHAYLGYRLTGKWLTSTASADPMGLLDMRRLDWSDEILEAACIPRSILPPVVAPGTVLGEVTPQAAKQTGLPVGTPLVAAGGDGQCAGTGVAALRPGRAYINLGTAVVSGTYSREYQYHPAFRTETAVAEAGYVLETCVRSGTFLIDWLIGEVFGAGAMDRAATLAALEAEASASPIGAGGVMLLPYWQGCMTPHWDSAARGVIAGLSGSTCRGDVFRAVLEGLVLEIAQATRHAVAATGVQIDHFVAIGGGAASDLWLQILADVMALPVRRSTTGEASSLGAAMAAAKGAGWFATIAEASEVMASKPTRQFDPDPTRSSRYDELRAVHDELWPAIAAWNRRLRTFAAGG